MLASTTFRFSVGFFSLSYSYQLSLHSLSFVVFVSKQSSLVDERIDQEWRHTSTDSHPSSLVQSKCCQNMFHRHLKATLHRNYINGVSRRRCNNTNHSGPSTQRQVRKRTFFHLRILHLRWKKFLKKIFFFLEPTASIVHISERNDNTNAYKTRSLPSKHKQRPVSSIDDLDELYSKVNFSKKLRNRMTNDEAAIIAFCRSKSQNLSQFSGSGPKGDDAMVIYDERTAL